MQGGYCGGVVLVAANSKEEAFLTAATSNDNVHYWFDWVTKRGGYAQPFSEDAKCQSDFFPFDCWEEYEHLSSDYSKPTLIVAAFHAE